MRYGHLLTSYPPSSLFLLPSSLLHHPSSSSSPSVPLLSCFPPFVHFYCPSPFRKVISVIQLCTLPLPTESTTCQCLSAYASYYYRYPDAVNYDAYYHYRV